MPWLRRNTQCFGCASYGHQRMHAVRRAAAERAVGAVAWLPGVLGFHGLAAQFYHWLMAYAVRNEQTATAALRLYVLYCHRLAGHAAQKQLGAMEVLRIQQLPASCCHGLVAHAADDPTREAQCLTVVALDCAMPVGLIAATGAGWKKTDSADYLLW